MEWLESWDIDFIMTSIFSFYIISDDVEPQKMLCLGKGQGRQPSLTFIAVLSQVL